ncbi:hypothetical protein AOLI_G00093060 [Acnodon oligacanthus]
MPVWLMTPQSCFRSLSLHICFSWSDSRFKLTKCLMVGWGESGAALLRTTSLGGASCQASDEISARLPFIRYAEQGFVGNVVLRGTRAKAASDARNYTSHKRSWLVSANRWFITELFCFILLVEDLRTRKRKPRSSSD